MMMNIARHTMAAIANIIIGVDDYYNIAQRRNDDTQDAAHDRDGLREGKGDSTMHAAAQREGAF